MDPRAGQGRVVRLPGTGQRNERGLAAVLADVPDAKLGHFNGVPGDLYVCPPEAHEADHGAKLTTILFVLVHARTGLHVAASSPGYPVGLLGSSSQL